MQNYNEAYSKWVNESRLETALREELVAIAHNNREIEDRFYTELAFGTAGLRGILGAGTNRMNLSVVRRATQGLADYLNTFEAAGSRGVAIAYDSRKMSDTFALETALVLANNGIKAYLYSTLHSVPQLSFTVRHLGCLAGVVITASHNPPAYNGYKVYWEHGGQVGPEQAEEILEHIQLADYFGSVPMERGEAQRKGLLVFIGQEIDEAYYEAVETQLLNPQLLKERGRECKLVYTPLHGSGYVPVTTLLQRVGIRHVEVVQEQAQPDGDFPTVTAPNPEDPNAFTLAFLLADRCGANVILATDPDADRLGVAVRNGHCGFTLLTGNQIGCLLIHYMLSVSAEKKTLENESLVVKSIVSTRMADAICTAYGVEIREVLTGFRFISEQIDECERKGRNFLFGFEESYGFLSGSASRDKDAVSSAMLVAEAAVYYREHGKTLYDVLADMYEKYGYYNEAVKSYTLSGKEGIEKIEEAMERLRSEWIQEFGGIRVLRREDFNSGIRQNWDGGEEEIMLPRSNVLRYSLDTGAWLCIRPSGTEPKLKLYIGANASCEEAVDGMLKSILEHVDGRLQRLLYG